MKILIAGATGLIGSALVHHWQNTYEITAIGRNLLKLQEQFSSLVQCVDWARLQTLNARDFDVVINLCGKNISAQRWSERFKNDLIQSRVQTTETLIDWIRHYQASSHFICANAVGIYGLQKNGDPAAMDEDTAIDKSAPRDFLQKIGIEWQNAAEQALQYDIPLTITRFGVVLKKGEGMLQKLTPTFKFGLGSIIGDGEQILSWIHIEDVVHAFDFLLQRRLQGPVNLCSPQPVSQRSFARGLARAMHRPLLLRTPAFLMQWIFGEMGECLIVHGQRVIPKRLCQQGYTFRYPDIEKALQAEFGS